MAPTLDDLFASPDHYLHSFDGDDAVFVPMDHAAYRSSIFLDRRIVSAAGGAMRVPIAALLRPAGKPATIGWIFHVAHCGSTLLARVLGELADNLVLREPFALRQLGMEPDAVRLALVMAMLGKRYPGGGATIVKANVPVNFILSEIAVLDPSAPAVLLHCTLRDYVLAILRSDNHRLWLRNVTSQLAPYLGDLSALSDAERAAALWLAHTRRYAAALAQMPRARTLDAEVFFGQPAAAVLAVARHFGIATSAAAVAEQVSGPLFATYSKNPDVPFDNAARIARRSALEEGLAPEIAAAQGWLDGAGADIDVLVAAIAEAALIV